ncbi:hypothetical protein [Candidatus Sororendozoicomonas aggregata]|uniref:hypothetical protein n=1 Tax=Candidatus Sororendozoicomonas aggregata TaxID=3073239 RepID=UPI002ED41814
MAELYPDLLAAVTERVVFNFTPLGGQGCRSINYRFNPLPFWHYPPLGVPAATERLFCVLSHFKRFISLELAT